MLPSADYDVARALDLVQGLRDSLKGEGRRLTDLALDLIEAGADAEQRDRWSDDEARGAPASTATSAQNGAAA